MFHWWGIQGKGTLDKGRVYKLGSLQKYPENTQVKKWLSYQKVHLAICELIV